MASSRQFIIDLKSDFNQAPTPELKRLVCESAILLANEIFKGLTLRIILILISFLKATIRNTNT